jgi:hypothetical protein
MAAMSGALLCKKVHHPWRRRSSRGHYASSVQLSTRRHCFTRRAVKPLVLPSQTCCASGGLVARYPGILAIQCRYGCKDDGDGDSQTKHDYRRTMLSQWMSLQGQKPQRRADVLVPKNATRGFKGKPYQIGSRRVTFTLATVPVGVLISISATLNEPGLSYT